MIGEKLFLSVTTILVNIVRSVVVLFKRIIFILEQTIQSNGTM